MSPSEYMKLYREMTVDLPGGSKVTVDDHAYVWNRPGKHSADKGLAMWSKMKHNLEKLSPAPPHKHAHRHTPPTPHALEGVGALVGRAINSPVGLIAEVADSFLTAITHIEVNPMQEIRQLGRPLRFVPYGKGSPEMVAIYLRLAVMAGVTKPHTLQQFLDDRYVGIDCSGFVSNYLASIGKMEKEEVGDHNAKSYASGHPKRTSIEELSNLDIMVWHDGGHVAIMETPEKNSAGVQALVTESNGHRGLDCETYTFDSVDKSGLFKVRRADGSRHTVRIFDWDLDV